LCELREICQRIDPSAVDGYQPHRLPGARQIIMRGLLDHAGNADQLAGQLVSLSYSRETERTADANGVAYLQASGLRDVRQAVDPATHCVRGFEIQYAQRVSAVMRRLSTSLFPISVDNI